ncbi:hypothetical protein D3C73_1021370 [compost metagenome]
MARFYGCGVHALLFAVRDVRSSAHWRTEQRDQEPVPQVRSLVAKAAPIYPGADYCAAAWRRPQSVGQTNPGVVSTARGLSAQDAGGLRRFLHQIRPGALHPLGPAACRIYQ